MQSITVLGRIQEYGTETEGAQTNDDAVLGSPDYIILDTDGQTAGHQAAVVRIEHGGEDQLLEALVKVMTQCLHFVPNVNRIGGAAVNGEIVNVHARQFESGAQEGF